MKGLLTLLLPLSLLGCTTPSTVFNGTVVSTSTGQPLDGARIEIRSDSQKSFEMPLAQTHTDGNGKFAIELPQAEGVLSISAAHINHEPVQRVIPGDGKKEVALGTIELQEIFNSGQQQRWKEMRRQLFSK